MNRTIWCFWTGDNDLTPNRARNLESMKKVLGNVQLITNKSLEEYIVPSDPIPDAYWNLSLTHRADFLRFYFMYHYGGGYADIKNYTKSWDRYFDRFDENPKLEIIGTRETSRDGVFEFELKSGYHELLCFGWFIMRRGCVLSKMMRDRAYKTLREFESRLAENPAKVPRDHLNMELEDGSLSKYPLRWGKIGGSVFHPMIAKRLSMLSPIEKANHINYDLPGWDFKDNYL